jgi:hypothetical protein
MYSTESDIIWMKVNNEFTYIVSGYHSTRVIGWKMELKS